MDHGCVKYNCARSIVTIAVRSFEEAVTHLKRAWCTLGAVLRSFLKTARHIQPSDEELQSPVLLSPSLREFFAVPTGGTVVRRHTRETQRWLEGCVKVRSVPTIEGCGADLTNELVFYFTTSALEILNFIRNQLTRNLCSAFYCFIGMNKALNNQ